MLLLGGGTAGLGDVSNLGCLGKFGLKSWRYPDVSALDEKQVKNAGGEPVVQLRKLYFVYFGS